MKEMFFHDMEELFSFLQKEYGPTWYDQVFVKILDRSAKVEDGKSMIEVRISDLNETNEELSFEEIEKLLKNENISNEEYEKALKEYAEPKVMVNTSSDGKKAYMTIYPGIEREMPSIDEILQTVESQGIKYGLEREEIEKAIEEHCILKPILIAEGTEPTRSKDAQLKLLFPPSGVRLKKVDEKDKVDYASMYEVVLCHEEETLAAKIPAEEGKSGYDVFGKEMPVKEPKNINLLRFVGENVKLSKDGNSIVSSIDGQPYFSKEGLKEEKINVREIYVVEGDLDYSIGNIDFLGTIWIKGNAEEKFKVKAGKDVIVDGIVGEADIEAAGSIIIKGGVFGKLRGKIVSHKGFKAKFLNEAFIVSYGDISVDEYIMNSRVISKGNVVVRGKGWITGESVKASGGVMANVIGSMSKVPTHVSAGINFEFSKKAEEIEINLQLYVTKLGEISAMINKTLSAFKKLTGSFQKGNLLKFANRLEKRKTEILEEIEKLKSELKALKFSVRIGESEKNSKVIVRQKCFGGTRITIANETMAIHSNIGPTIFSLDQVKWRIIASSSKSWDVSKD